jgi:hypothetical protein
MKRLTMNLMIAAAALAAVAGSASAQTLNAEIPFAFRAGNKLMAPGSYRVTVKRGSGSTMFHFQAADTGRGIMLAEHTAGDPPKAWRNTGARLAFECDASRCALREVWTGTGDRVYHFEGPRLGRDDDKRVVEVRLGAVKTD